MVRTAWLLLRRPDLWFTALALVVRTFPWPKGWRHFRDVTYGVDKASNIPAEDTIRYLEWCKAHPKIF